MFLTAHELSIASFNMKICDDIWSNLDIARRDRDQIPLQGLLQDKLETCRVSLEPVAEFETKGL